MVGNTKFYYSGSEQSINKERCSELNILQKILDIKFKNIDLLNSSLTHKSYVNEVGRGENNERFEFLGDSVLGLIITDYLFRKRLDDNEGYLAKCKSHIVSENSLADIARQLTLENYLRVGRGEELSGGRQKKAILSDSLEAVIGAYYLDSGFSKCAVFVLRIFNDSIELVLEDKHDKDYKSILQEFVQRHYKSYPSYTVVRRTGPEHRKIFWVEVSINDRRFGPSKGLNKKDAEKEVAQHAYMQLTAKK